MDVPLCVYRLCLFYQNNKDNGKWVFLKTTILAVSFRRKPESILLLSSNEIKGNMDTAFRRYDNFGAFFMRLSSSFAVYNLSFLFLML